MTDVTAAAMAALDEMADQWAKEIDVRRYAEGLAIADDTVRVDRIEALLRQSFAEGAYRMYCRAVDDGMLSDGCEGPVMPETPSDEVLEALVSPQLDAAKEHYGPLYGPELRFAISESNKIGAREFYTRVRDALGKGVAKKAGGK